MLAGCPLNTLVSTDTCHIAVMALSKKAQIITNHYAFITKMQNNVCTDIRVSASTKTVPIHYNSKSDIE